MLQLRAYSAVVSVSLLLSACDMYTWFDVRHSVQPVPPVQCISSALLSTPDVVKVGKSDRNAGSDYVPVELRDPATGTRHRAAIIRDSSGVTMDYAWGVGVFAHGPSPTELQQVSRQARRVLMHVRDACAPNTPDAFECIVDHQRVVSCASPAA